MSVMVVSVAKINSKFGMNRYGEMDPVIDKLVTKCVWSYVCVNKFDKKQNQWVN